MKTLMLPKLVGCLTAIVLLVQMGTTALAQSQTNTLRIGVYDSRAIAIAYANSADFQQSLKAVRSEHDQAKAGKNDPQMKVIEARMKLRQRRMHEQAFSTGSVSGIMAKLKDSLPEVASHANVQVIVSKWEINHQGAQMEQVDLTDELVALFHPSPKVLGWVKSLQHQAPLPMEQITDDMD